MEIQKVDLLSTKKIIADIATLYKTTFGSEPWNEGFTCPGCQSCFPLGYGKTHCGFCLAQGTKIILNEHWPEEKICTDFMTEMHKPDAVCFIASVGLRVIGCTWGYGITIDTRSAENLDAPGIADMISGRFFYLDEVFVHPEYQKKGVGRVLVETIFREQLQNRVLLRTLANSQMHKLSMSLGLEVLMEISRGRLILASRT